MSGGLIVLVYMAGIATAVAVPLAYDFGLWVLEEIRRARTAIGAWRGRH